ncbi:MAG: TolC family protein, partial [Pseudomonadota bacterium]|nr:TolC family protein [Pseudomonadota bacterium]
MFVICFLFGLSGCAAYHSEPLPHTPAFGKTPADVEVDASKLDVPSLQSYLFNAADGLDMTETAILAVLNNPDLKLARDDAAVSHAQAFAAGLLPDPQFTPAEDLTMPSGPGLYNAYTLGLSYDISALIKFPSALRAEHAEYKKIDLTLLWQELQTISQARLLFAKTLAQDKTLAILKDYHEYLEEKRKTVLEAVQHGGLSMDAASPLLSTYLDMSGKYYDVERQSAKNHRDLNALLGLAPDTKLQLVDSALPEFDMMMLPAIRDDLPKRRPDLLALEEGYAAQDEHYWQAILAQFPLVNASVNRARDNTGINSRGFSLTINLPLFNGNQGAIAVEKATRQKLHDEYQIRLNQAYAEITGIA